MENKENTPRRARLTLAIRHGACLTCGDEWTERGIICVCPECHSRNVKETRAAVTQGRQT